MRKMLALSCGVLLSSCGINLYSLPFSTSTALHNGPALKFLKDGGPEEVGGPEAALTVKDPYADGRLLVLTASGGGMRASAFALGVLAELDELKEVAWRDNTAFDEIDLISSVSGGSWAVAAVLVDREMDSTQPLSRRMRDIEARYAELSHARVREWAKHFIPSVTKGRTYADIYKSGAKSPLPFTYFNSTLFPSHSPFVFTPAYLRHYGVIGLGDPASPGRVIVKDSGLANIPIGYAASASGAVPGYTSAFAETNLCPTEGGPSYCFANRKGGVRNNLQLMDGGLYDNIGYKTALEVGLANRDRIRGIPATIIMIDSADAEDFQTVPRKGRDGGHIIDIARASSFPNQNATFDRLRNPAFAAAGFDQRILLDFSSAADFDVVRDGPELEGLPELAYFAAHGVSCYGDDSRVVEAGKTAIAPANPGSWRDNLDRLEKKGGDCVAMNFARVGYLHKTTFKYDPHFFQLRYQLGRLAVRMHRREIRAAVFRTGRIPVL